MSDIVDPPVSVLMLPGRTTSADQWFEDGYALYEGQVYDFHVDRKDQYQALCHPRTPEAFLSSDVPCEHKAWLRAYLAQRDRGIVEK